MRKIPLFYTGERWHFFEHHLIRWGIHKSEIKNAYEARIIRGIRGGVLFTPGFARCTPKEAEVITVARQHDLKIIGILTAPDQQEKLVSNIGPAGFWIDEADTIPAEILPGTEQKQNT